VRTEEEEEKEKNEREGGGEGEGGDGIEKEEGKARVGEGGEGRWAKLTYSPRLRNTKGGGEEKGEWGRTEITVVLFHCILFLSKEIHLLMARGRRTGGGGDRGDREVGGERKEEGRLHLAQQRRTKINRIRIEIRRNL